MYWGDTMPYLSEILHTVFLLAILVTPVFVIAYPTTDFLTGVNIALVFLYILFGLPAMFTSAWYIFVPKDSASLMYFLAFVLYCIPLLKALSFVRTCPILKVSIGTKIGILFLYILLAMLTLLIYGMSFDAPSSTANLGYVLVVAFYCISLLVIPGILVSRVLSV